MPTKTKLEKAVEEHIGGFSRAQREIIMSQLQEYRRNRARIADITDALAMRVSSVSTSGANAVMAERIALAEEKASLLKANAEIADMLFGRLSGGDAA